ncbi:hypothetical protein RvY_06142 [Ramazzottius varieornatus]|uniref:WAP domain-containing protein n=1 Tax=Ramazzottius varieornatus TaxID=947166 RepID=A0A1D1V309_RAMVA|nr:hypothetical protein RvY_06142 [Ramazzottius varieornatus]
MRLDGSSMGHSIGLSSLSSWLLLSSCFLPIIYAVDKPRKSARAYSSPSSSSNSLDGSSSGGRSNAFNDNFDTAYDSMNLNNQGSSQRIRISLPNPPRPPRPPMPMKAPKMGNFENDPNRMPNMPRPPAPPAGFGPMDIEFNFPSYEPSVDDSFFDSDSGFGNTGYNSGFGSGNTNHRGSYSNNNNANSNSNSNSGSGGGGGGGSSYSMRTKYAGTYYNRSSGGNSSTTPRTATLSSTQYATSTTAAYGGAGGVGGVTGSTTTTVAPGSLLPCSPSSDPSITGGRCVNTAALSTLCKTPFAAAPSTNCQTGERCCFSRAVTPAPTPATVTAATPTATTSANATPSSTTPRTIPEGTACSPLTNPTVTNGRCITTNVVSTQCVGQQLAKSNQCAASQFCCFRAPQAVGGAGAVPAGNRLTVEVSIPSESAASISASSKGSCRPASNPSANGQCIEADNLASLCKGRQASKSADCASQEWCCILNQDDSTRLHVSAAAQSASTSDSATCRVATNPSASGHCIGLQNLASSCRGHQASKSSDCGPQEWCCIDDEPSANRVVAGVVPDLQPALTASADGGTCRPKTNLSATGQCISSENVASQCASRQASRSDDCNTQSWCCVSGPASGTCRPASNPSASGQCVPTAILSSQCSGRTASKSVDCASDQWCCISSPPNSEGSTSTTTTQLPPASSTQGSSGGSSTQSTSSSTTQATAGSTTQSTGGAGGNTCRPATNPSASGQCFPTASLSSQCSGRSASKSTDCSSDQWCCINPATLPGTVPVGTACTPRSNPAARGTCLATSSLANDCKGRPAAKSDNCGGDQWCCFAQGAASANKEANVEVKITIDGSANAAGQSSNAVLAGPSITQGAQCTPNDNPNVKNGKCLTMRELSQQCVDQKASASTDCAFGRFCCYSDNEVGGGSNQAAVDLPPSSAPSVSVQVNKEASSAAAASDGPSVVISTASASSASSTNKEGSSSVVISTSSATSGTTKTCSPNSNQAIKNGACMTIRELRISCIEQKASPSSDCDLGSWCCFSEDNAVVPPPQANTQVKIEVQAPAVDNTVAAVSDTAQCVPNSKPDISNGVCLPTKDLRTRCKNQRVSKSPQCKLGQWCCFNDSGAPVQLTLNEFSRNINTL